MSISAYIEARIRQAPPPGAPIVEGSTPVVSFGDVRTATVATLGFNPSDLEFLDKDGKFLPEQQRRLATTSSLGVDDLTAAPAKAVRRVFQECNEYFHRNPYRRWFDRLERAVLQPLGVSYYDGSACHLDLVQWATKPKWGSLERARKQRLIDADVDFIRRQLSHEHIELLLLNGSGVARQCSKLLDSPLTKRSIPGRSGDTLFVGRTPQCVRVIGWNKNLQSSWGVSNGYTGALALCILQEREGTRADMSKPNRSKVKSDGCTVGPGRSMPLAEVVRDYCENTDNRKDGKTHQQHLKEDLRRFKKMTLSDAIRTAALCETAEPKRNGKWKRHGHQRRIKKKVLDRASNVLQATSHKIGHCRNFHALHTLVVKLLHGVKGVGRLYYYDVSLRIGAHLRRLPRKVYLHAGTRKGAKKLDLDTNNGILEMNALPAALHQVNAYEVEDILCIYKDRF